MGDIQKISNSLTETLRDTDLQNISTDLFEIALDSFLKDGLLKDIPVLGTIIGLTRTSFNVHDRLFKKKIIYFLAQLKEIPQPKRQKQIEKIESSANPLLNRTPVPRES